MGRREEEEKENHNIFHCQQKELFLLFSPTGKYSSAAAWS
jgi:hypothetical protein